MATHSVFLPGKPHGLRSLVVYRPQGCKKSDTTEHTACPETCIPPRGICLDALMEECVTDPVHDTSCLTVHTVHTVR